MADATGSFGVVEVSREGDQALVCCSFDAGGCVARMTGNAVVGGKGVSRAESGLHGRVAAYATGQYGVLR